MRQSGDGSLETPLDAHILRKRLEERFPNQSIGPVRWRERRLLIQGGEPPPAIQRGGTEPGKVTLSLSSHPEAIKIDAKVH